MRLVRPVVVLSFLLMISFLAAPAPVAAEGAGKNPCSMKNPCAAKEMMKNPCSMKNPCDMKEMMKNPCGMKAMPAGGATPIREKAIKDTAKLARQGNALGGAATHDTPVTV